MKQICFDMDGTLAAFYAVPNWLEKIRKEDVSPYADAKPMWDMKALASVVQKLRGAGWEIRIITWPSMTATPAFRQETYQIKREWLARYGFPYDHFHGVKYGTTKANCARKAAGEDIAILIDDNQKIREGWHLGPTINPETENIIDALTALL